VEFLEHERADAGQPARTELPPDGLRIARQIADRSKLQPREASAGDPVEDFGIRRVVRRVGEVDAPGNGPGGELGSAPRRD